MEWKCFSIKQHLLIRNTLSEFFVRNLACDQINRQFQCIFQCKAKTGERKQRADFTFINVYIDIAFSLAIPLAYEPNKYKESTPYYCAIGVTIFLISSIV